MPPRFPIEAIVDIGRKLHVFIEDRGRSGDLSIFLCGGAGEAQANIRHQVAVDLPLQSKYTYKVYFPEHLFMDVLHGHHRTDLLGLEGQLADSVHAVAILLHSSGTIAELGAFANHETLRKKLIVFVDPGYKRDKSFINLGPIRHLQRRKCGSVHYIPLVPKSASEIAAYIREFSRELSKDESLQPSTNLDNPIQAYEFLLALLYVLPPVSLEVLREVSIQVSSLDRSAMSVVVDAVVGTIIRDGLATRTPVGLCTTQQAARRLFCEGKANVIRERRRFLYDLRTVALNRLLRRRNRLEKREYAAWTTP